ncbi:hypothetical protein GGQ85_001824 [Nitrobacter vulgaris]|nr:hypothetical protein [Nitrobacter vulgaris]
MRRTRVGRSGSVFPSETTAFLLTTASLKPEVSYRFATEIRLRNFLKLNLIRTRSAASIKVCSDEQPTAGEAMQIRRSRRPLRLMIRRGPRGCGL